MGDLWDLWQESELINQAEISESFEDRISNLEHRLEATVDLLQSLIKTIEQLHDMDLDGDGEVG